MLFQSFPRVVAFDDSNGGAFAAERWSLKVFGEVWGAFGGCEGIGVDEVASAAGFVGMGLSGDGREEGKELCAGTGEMRTIEGIG